MKCLSLFSAGDRSRQQPIVLVLVVVVEFPGVEYEDEDDDEDDCQPSIGTEFRMNDGQKKRILVVDDHPHGAQIVGKFLVEEGYAAVLAYSGEEAMNRLAAEGFDAVISEVQMPGMSGFELLQNVHADWPHLPVILMALFVGKGMRESALAWGALAVLEKPFTRAAMKASLESALQASLQAMNGTLVSRPAAVPVK